MKRILNLNDFSGPALKIILMIGFGFSAGMYLLYRGLELAGLRVPVLERLIWILVAAGGLGLLFFFALVILELIQDDVLYRQYLRERGQQVDGECPFCGNRQLRTFEQVCPVCGERIHCANIGNALE